MTNAGRWIGIAALCALVVGCGKSVPAAAPASSATIPPAPAATGPAASAAPAASHSAAAPAASSAPAGRGEGQMCGGIAGLMCGPGLTCVYNTMMCDPHHGGRDCSGVCRAPHPDAGAKH